MTRILSADKNGIKTAADIIKRGGIVAFPTETVYGLGGDATDPGSAEKIYAAKGRPSDNPLIIHIANAAEAEKYAYTNDTYYKLTEAFCPGPITIILKKKDTIPYEVTGGLDTVAVRIPSHPVARDFIKACGVAVAAPSANVSGSPSPTKAEHVLADLYGRIDAVIDGGDCGIGLESTIVKITDGIAVILRPGAVTEEMLSGLLPVRRDRTLLDKPDDNVRPEAPGMKYRHYAPKAPVTLLKGPHGDVTEYMKNALISDPSTGVICLYSDKDSLKGKNVLYLPDDAEGQARTLFSLLREFDGTDAKRILSVTPSRVGIGLAVFNRLNKASGFATKRVGISIPVLGLTGQSGAGKSTVASEFAKRGAYVADCDAIYHELLTSDSGLTRELAVKFPDAVVGGAVDRKILADIVFSDKDKLSTLNTLTHRVVLNEVRKRLKRAEASGYGFAVVDAPQLFEAGYDNECTAVIGVCAPEDVRADRTMKRDGITRERFLARIANQHNEDFFRVYCDCIIENGYGCDLTDQIDFVTEKYIKGKKQ